MARAAGIWHSGARVSLPRHPLRALVRLLGFLIIVVFALIDLGARSLAGRLDVKGRARWLHRWTGRALRWMGIRVRAEGQPPASGLVICNHLGYLDVFVLSAIAPTVFVSNHEVSDWPLAGALTRMAGTVFIDRRRRADVIRVGEALGPIIEAGQPVALFLEGTSTGGDRVLPFHSSLLAPATREGWTVTPAHITYAGDGLTTAELAYWGDAVFFPHFLEVMGLRRGEAAVVFGTPRPAAGDRRALAVQLRAEVCTLGGREAGPAR
jgi:1-acyl-sn-glycerol-3-phosphate acyltransferase